MVMRPTFAATLMLVLLGGCAFWPRLPSESSIVDTYPSRYTVPTEARKYTEKILKEADAILKSDDDFELITSYSLFGLAVATGVNVAGDGSRAPLKNLALAAAGILGFREVVKPQDQQRIFTATKKSLRCALDLDSQLEDALPKISGIRIRSNFAGASLTQLAIRGGDAPAVQLDKFAALQYRAQAALLESAVENLRSALQRAAQPSNRAQKLSRTVDEIRDVVAQQLRALVDPTAVTAATQKRFADTAAEIARNYAAAAQYKKDLKPPPADGAMMIAVENATAPTLSSIEALLATAKPVVDGYTSCLDPFNPASPSTNP